MKPRNIQSHGLPFLGGRCLVNFEVVGSRGGPFHPVGVFLLTLATGTTPKTLVSLSQQT